MLPMLTVLVLVLAGSFLGTLALMRGVQRLQGPAALPASGLAHAARSTGSFVGPDDDLAFLRELRRRIDLGHFRH